MKMRFKRYRDLSFSVKIGILVFLAGFLPVGLVLALSLGQIQRQHNEQQTYALNQGFEQVSQAVVDRMESLHNISTLLAVSDSSGVESVLTEEAADISDQLMDFSAINSYAYGMEMAFTSGKILFYIDDSYPVINSVSGRFHSLSSVKDTAWARELAANEGAPTWVVFSEGEEEKNQLAIVRYLWSKEDYSKSVGILAIVMEAEHMEELMIDANKEQVFFLENAKGEVLATNAPAEIPEDLSLQLRGESADSFHEVMTKNGPCLARSRKLDKHGTYLVSMIPMSVIRENSFVAAFRLGVGYLVICVAVTFAVIPLVSLLTRRLKMMGKQMEDSGDGSLHRIENVEDSDDEVGQLIRRYNEMVDRVEELLRKQYALGEEKKEAELKALQSQINPHFLYNTLDMINWMAKKNEAENIRDVVQAMSRFYRLTLSRGMDTITIGDEIRMCDAYMEIQKRRYKGKINYEVSVDEEVEQYLIPKITLQPFLENAIIHGINEKEEPRGTIHVCGFMEDNRITLSVTDDGVGMKEGQMGPGSGSHYGMKNIKKRLELFYQEEIPIQVESTPGIGTCIILNIPAKKDV